MKFGDLRKICLIGGGEPMVFAGQFLASRSVYVHCILAPRHEDSELPLSGQILKDALHAGGVSYVTVNDINDPAVIAQHLKTQNYDLALCFGPAWVFSKNVRECFRAGMINFNGIPVPHYLGGAHYTWQILNNDRRSGMTLQMITGRVDRGDILAQEIRALSKSVRTPQDYYRENYDIACGFLVDCLERFLKGKEFKTQSFSDVDANRLYFPRLLTLHQAYIDWRWNGTQIERFCCAFDAPYTGASSFIGDRRVFLKAVTLEKGENFHPFCSGLIVRKYDNHLYIATDQGLLRVALATDENGHDVIGQLNEGQRFYTPESVLDYAMKFQPHIGSTKPS